MSAFDIPLNSTIPVMHIRGLPDRAHLFTGRMVVKIMFFKVATGNVSSAVGSVSFTSQGATTRQSTRPLGAVGADAGPASEIGFQITCRQEGYNVSGWQPRYRYAILRAKR